MSGNQQDSIIAWYENDGSGNFISQHNITDLASYVQSVYAIDIDGDYDLDVISCGNNKIVWFKNTDGYGSYSNQNYIIDTLNAPISIYAIDFDNDSDIDIVSASYGDSLVYWFENIDGYGNFSPINIISDTVFNAMAVYACDMDSDGDNDVISASVDIIFHENDGLGNFNQHDIISPTMLGGQSVYACDMDDDGDNDVISAELSALMYHQNNLGSFNTQFIATAGVDGLFSVYASDLDGDGDNDVLCASMGSISWFKNLGLNSIEQIDNSNIDIYPNPIIDYAYLSAKNIVRYEIFNQIGEVIASVEDNNSIDLSDKPTGIYHIKIVLENQIVVKKLLKQ